MDPDSTESCRFVDNDNVMTVWLPTLALVNNNSYPEKSSQSWQLRSDSLCWCGGTLHVTTNVSVCHVSGLYCRVTGATSFKEGYFFRAFSILPDTSFLLWT